MRRLSPSKAKVVLLLSASVRLVTFPFADSDDPNSMDLRIFRTLLGEDWGWWRTVTLNLDRITALLDSGDPIPAWLMPADSKAACATAR